MAITYGSTPGTIITSFLVSTTCGTQGGGLAANEVDIPNATPSSNTGYGGDVGVGTLGVGDVFVGRRIMFDRAGTPEERIVTGIAGTTLTLHEDLDTAPVSGTTFDLYYELADVEEGSGSGGISLASRTGLWTLTRIITIGTGAATPAGLSMLGGQALECADRGTADSFLVESDGYFKAGYYSGGLPISGCIFAMTAASADEPCMSFVSGAEASFLDCLIWGQVATLSQISPTGATVIYDKTKILKGTEEIELYGDTILNSSIVGEAKSTEIVRVDASTVCNGLTLEGVQVLDTAADTTTETIELEGVVFSGVAGYVDVRQNKTINLIDPVWDVTTYTQLTWTGTSTGNELNHRPSIKVTAQEADGTLLQNALVNVYENTILADLVLELTTDANGYAEDSFIYNKHATNSATTTYGGHALQAGAWIGSQPYLPFVAAQVSTSNFSGSIVLATDSNVVQTTQATALTAGASVTWNEDTNPSEIADFTLGSGTLAVGMIITYSPSGAIGTITESVSGDSTAGELHLKDRNATAIGTTQTFSRTGGTAGTFSGTHTDASEQPFSIWVDAATISYQALYDFIAAKTTETTLSAMGELIWEWCRSAQAQAFYATGTSFFTERSNSKGIMIVNGGTGTLDYTTDDDGVQWGPPATVSVGLSGVTEGTPVTIIAAETVGTITEGDVILSDFADSAGEVSISFNYEVAFNPSGLDVTSTARNQGVAVAAISEDGGVFVDETAEASSNSANDMTLLPATPVVNDAYNLGHNEQFNRLKIDVSTVLTHTGAPTLTWEYWNGAWVALSGVEDETSGFETLGENVIRYTLPGDWTTTTINGQGPLYYVRARLSVLGTITQAPAGQTATLDTTRYLPYTGDRVISSTGLADLASWTEDTISKFEQTD